MLCAELLVPVWDDEESSNPLLPAFTVPELPPSAAGVCEAAVADPESLCGRVLADWPVLALDEGVADSALELVFVVELVCAELVLEFVECFFFALEVLLASVCATPNAPTSRTVPAVSKILLTPEFATSNLVFSL